ncbi:outer membrane lipoprotein carrier protein LolA [Acidobacteriota bacterium]
MGKPGIIVIYIIIFILLIPAWAQQNENDYKDILFKMKERFKEIKTYQCIYEMFTAKGKKTEKVVSNYFFKAPKMVRMESREGRFKSTVMLYIPHKIRVKLGRGVFSLFIFRFKPNHKWVTNLRGYGLHQSDWGWYIDRHIQLLELTEAEFSGEEVTAGRDTMKYKLISKDPEKTGNVAQEILWIDKKELIPVKYVQYSTQGKILMSGLYTDIQLNVDLDNKIFKKFK